VFRAALLLLLSWAIAEDSDATCKAGEPGCDETPEEENPCPALTGEQGVVIKGCAQGSKYWRWSMDRFYSNDHEGALGFLEKAYSKCMKKQNLTRTELCMRGWARDVIQYRWLLEGPGVVEECQTEAKEKYSSGGKKVEECAQTFSEALDSAVEEDDKKKIGELYREILTKCAGVSDACAAQNSHMLAKTSQQELPAEEEGASGKDGDESKGMWGGLQKILERRWKQQTSL
jgi:hypothetical protein